MSHGSSSSEKCEPNLVPLLDLVLQLVMFFMVCANFVMEQVNEAIKLPAALAAKPLAPNDPETLYLNVSAQGKVLLSGFQMQANGGKPTLDNADQVRLFVARLYAEDIQKSPNQEP